MPVHYLETGSTDPCANLAREQFVVENRPERSELEAVLSRFDCASLFGGITQKEVISQMLGEGD